MIAIVDYGVGNLFSVEKAFLKFSPDVVLTSDAKVIEKPIKLYFLVWGLLVIA